jgi:hypothetical protein
MTRRAVLAVALGLVGGLVAGCGLDQQSAPELITVTATPTGAGPAPPPRTTGVVEVYLVQDGRLVPVLRPGRTRQDALDRLAEGPSRLEARDGVRTALAPQPLVLAAQRPEPGVVVVDVGPDFAALAGRDQLLAVAQLVWTVTDLCCAEAVQVRLEGRAVSLPTDSGLTERAVRRADYGSVEPV